MQPSPRPWRLRSREDSLDIDIIYDRDGNDLMEVDGNDTSLALDSANASRIVHCVNLFDELVDRLETMCDLAELQNGFEDEDGWASIKRSREVLEKARKADA